LERYVALAALLGILLFVAWVRLRLADVPLERDEGEYAYAGQLILRGVPPYQFAYNMKFPGTYYAYALILGAFGETSRGIHLGLLVVNCATVVLVFLLGRRLLGSSPAVVAASTFAVLTLDRGVLGAFAHATHFVVLFAVAGFLLLVRALDRPRVFMFIAAGAALGTALLMKQHAASFLLISVAMTWWSTRRTVGSRIATLQAAWLCVGASLPAVALLGVLLAHDGVGRFYFWTFRYALEYVSQLPLDRGLQQLEFGWQTVTEATHWLWALAGVGLCWMWATRWNAMTRWCVTGLLVAGALATVPGLHFSLHYFVVILPGIALLCGVAVEAIEWFAARLMPSRAASAVALAVPAMLLLLWVSSQRAYLATMSPQALNRETYGAEAFVESPEIGRYIHDHSSPGDRVAVLGSEPQIYFYSRRTSATGFIYMYPLMEQQPFAAVMQRDMILEIEESQPKYLVFVRVPTSWMATSPPERLFAWATAYIEACYELVGVLDLSQVGAPVSTWEERANRYFPPPDVGVFTFRRRSSECSGRSAARQSTLP
jgi:4-amino-4-deoxy-L-arabinose transferase-like glycosyltransferase